MADGNGSPRTRGRRWVRALLCCLPLLVVAGVAAPGVVQVVAQLGVEAQVAPSEEKVELSFPEGVYLGRQPMLPVPRDFSAGFVPELMDLEHLFARKDMVSDPAARLFARMMTFPSSSGDVIVIENVERPLPRVEFKDPVLLGGLVAKDWPPPDASFLPLWGPIPAGGDGFTYDDPLGPFIPGPVPEPGSAMLLGSGLAALAWRRRLERA